MFVTQSYHQMHKILLHVYLVLLLHHPNASSQSLPVVEASPPWARWIGGVWIPKPGNKMYNANEMLNIFDQRSVLVLGDSLGRRLSATLAAIVVVGSNDKSASFPNSLVENKDLLAEGGHEEIAYPLGDGKGKILFQWAPQVTDLIFRLKAIDEQHTDANRPNYTDIVVCLGIHDSMQFKELLPALHSEIKEAMGLLEKIAIEQHVRVVWRTSPYRWKKDGTSNSPGATGIGNVPENTAVENFEEPKYSMDTNKRMVKFNSFARQYELHKPVKERHVFILEFGREMAPRSVGAARTETVGGDSFEHFNIYGRMVCVQMLMHTWEFWEDGKINEAQEQEEEDNEDIPLGEETDMKVLTAMENDGNGEVTPFRAALSQLLRGAMR